MALIEKLTAIADAIRARTGSTDPMMLDQMPGQIANIGAGGANGVSYEVQISDRVAALVETGTQLLTPEVIITAVDYVES